MKRLLAIFLFLLPSFISAQNLDDKYANFKMVGASLTSGAGAKVPMRLRLLDYIESALPKDESDKIAEKKILVAFDYFFFSRFTELGDPNFDHARYVQETLSRWSEDNDYVFVAPLPTLENLSDKAKARLALNPKGVDGPLASTLGRVIHLLEASKYEKGVAAINAGIIQAHENSSKKNIFIVPVEVFYNMLAVPENYQPKIPTLKEIYTDDWVHFKDSGQAFALNEVILPTIFSALVIPQRKQNLKYGELSESETKRIRREFFKGEKEFVNDLAGSYWAKIPDKTNLQLTNAILHIPGEADVKIENKSNAQKLIKDLKESKWALEFKRLINISTLVAGKSGSTVGFPVYVLENNGTPVIALDLAQAMFFTTIPLSPSGQNLHHFSGYGYDHWSSYGFLIEFGIDPSTNYYFALDKNSQNPAQFTITWKIFSMLPNQKEESVRLPSLEEPWRSLLEKNSDDYPSVTFTIECEIEDIK